MFFCKCWLKEQSFFLAEKCIIVCLSKLTSTKWEITKNEIQLERNIPLTCATTNVADINTLGDIDVGSRNFKLPRVLPVGGFEGKATMPQLERNYEGESLNQERNKFNKKVFSMFEGRYAN